MQKYPVRIGTSIPTLKGCITIKSKAASSDALYVEEFVFDDDGNSFSEGEHIMSIHDIEHRMYDACGRLFKVVVED